MPTSTLSSTDPLTLGEDVFVLIATRFNTVDLVSASQVSVDWRTELLNTPTLWRRACLASGADEDDVRVTAPTCEEAVPGLHRWHQIALAHARTECNWTAGRFATTKHTLKFDHPLQNFSCDSRAGVIAVNADGNNDSLLLDRRSLAHVVCDGHAAHIVQDVEDGPRSIRVCRIVRGAGLAAVGTVPACPDERHSDWNLETRVDERGTSRLAVVVHRQGEQLEISVHDAPWDAEGVQLRPQPTDRPAFDVVSPAAYHQLTVQFVPVLDDTCYVFLQGFRAYLYNRHDEAAPLTTWPQLELPSGTLAPHATALAYRLRLPPLDDEFVTFSHANAWVPKVEHVTSTGMLPRNEGFRDAFEVPPKWISGPIRWYVCIDQTQLTRRSCYNDHDLFAIAHDTNLLILRDFRRVFRQCVRLHPAERAAYLGQHTVVLNFDAGISGLRALRDRFVVTTVSYSQDTLDPQTWDLWVLDSRNLPTLPLAPDAPRPALPALALRRAIPPVDGTDLNDFNSAWRVYSDTLFDSRAIYLLAERNDTIVAYEFDK
ncbi:uncharacterized protein LOC62_03G005159 [Vanrija pseudolonga]|uniref:F-box domain-containing protein n=1 Tax=Vanrija pseudolonga TaxID=143232 RepID=A0AAF0YBG9_9TREE|nr:hypothetical protein LOC62_03G005159 [Vanrija pseudolonga]